MDLRSILKCIREVNGKSVINMTTKNIYPMEDDKEIVIEPCGSLLTSTVRKGSFIRNNESIDLLKLIRKVDSNIAVITDPKTFEIYSDVADNVAYIDKHGLQIKTN